MYRRNSPVCGTFSRLFLVDGLKESVLIPTSIRGEYIMKLSAPKQATFWIAVVVAVIGLIGVLVPTLGLVSVAVWLIVIGFVLLALGNLLPNL